MNDREMLTTLVTAGNRFRLTPVVDDDFPRIRDAFDGQLRDATTHLNRTRPVVVCLCGSTRFYDAFQAANYRETMAGRIVLSVGFYPHCSERAHGENVGCTDEQKAALDSLHLRKVEMADEVLILNVGGYMGHSTIGELVHAMRLAKTVRWLEEGWFWSRVQFAKKEDCWEWQGPRMPSGYGLCRDSEGGGYAHRFAFEHANAVAAGEMCVLHSCDNPPCVNPDHLSLGTQGDNMRDMWAKGRGKVPSPARLPPKAWAWCSPGLPAGVTSELCEVHAALVQAEIEALRENEDRDYLDLLEDELGVGD